MAGVNKVILIGHLGRDPEVRTTESGAKVARFSLATTEIFKDKNTGERKEQTEWHNIICWRNLADIAEQYLTKGRQIYVEGRLRTRSWEDSNGVKKYTTEVYADTFSMLGTKSDSSSSIPMPTQEPFSKPQQPQEPENGNLPPFLAEEDDLPF